MSIKLMTAAWKYPDLNPGQKLVLLALCDNASDEGVCFPSVSTIAAKCSMGTRTVQEHLRRFEADGLIERHERTGRSTVYMVNVRKICTPAESAPLQNLHPTPAESAPITVTEPSVKKQEVKARASKRCPDDFQVTDELKAWAAEKAPLVDITAETEAFRDYEFAKARSDWKATWRTWMRRAQEQRERNTQRQQPAARRHPPERDYSKIDYGAGGLI